MNLSVGIVGLPNSGKSTLFNALLKRQIAQVAEYPFTTIEPNTGVVEVPDERLEKLAKIVAQDRVSELKVVPSAIKFIDIAGLVKGAHKGEGLGNAFLGHIREVDAILHVVRFFDRIKSPTTGEYIAGGIAHVMGTIHPLRDIEVVDNELQLAGIEKPTLYLVNLDERLLNDRVTQDKLREDLKYKMRIERVIFASLKLEMEISQLPQEEQKDYLAGLGVGPSGLDQLIKESYKLLDLITFFTIKGGRQVQAWPLKRGKTALEAAGEVHTDMTRGFIKAEVVRFDDLVTCGSWTCAHERGKIRFEGKDYELQDGDVIEFKFQP